MPHPAPESPAAQKVFPSPNHGERRDGRRPDMLVLHYTGMPDAGQALQWLCNPVSEVSCHYFVFEDGRVLQLVPEARRAWHAGVSSWAGETDLNSASLGIEIAHPGHDEAGRLAPYPEAQVAAVIALCRDLVARWGIRPERVLAHSDIAPARKRDPGESFPWARLAGAGLSGHWVRDRRRSATALLSKRGGGGPATSRRSAWSYVLAVSYGLEPRVRSIGVVRRDDGAGGSRRSSDHFRPERVDGVAAPRRSRRCGTLSRAAAGNRFGDLRSTRTEYHGHARGSLFGGASASYEDTGMPPFLVGRCVRVFQTRQFARLARKLRLPRRRLR